MKVHTIGGYEEVGMNMTAVEVNNKVVIFDMGYNMEEVIASDEQIDELTTNQTLETGAIPKDKQLLEKNVVAIVIGHGHLDHVGAIPKLAGAYDAPIISTPYTKKIIERALESDRKNINNQLVEVEKGVDHVIDEELKLEFIHVNHSIPDATLSYLKTPEGNVIYGNDMKIDRSPLIEEKTNVDRLKEIGNHEDLKLMIPGTTNIEKQGRCRSEESVKVELRDNINAAYEQGGAVVLTTFSSQISRLNTILDVNNGRKKVAFIGRSLKEYTKAAEELDLIDLSNVEVASYYDECEKLLSKISGEREEWLIVATGNQGEPGSQMQKLATDQYPFRFRKDDHVLFSSRTIPTPPSEANRYDLEKKLSDKGVRIYKNIHTSGHASREDHRDFIKLLQPENIIPSHGDLKKLSSYVELAREEGYTLEEDIHLGENGRIINLD